MLVFEDKVTRNKSAFLAKVIDISAKLDINPNWMMAVMNFESGLDSTIRNSNTQATGLIQFMPTTAVSLGTSIDELQQMTNVEQLDYVYKYLNQYKSKLISYIDLYLSVFFPAAMGKPDDWVIQTSRLSPDTIARANPVFDLDKNKQITIGEIKQAYNQHLPAAVANSNEFQKKNGFDGEIYLAKLDTNRGGVINERDFDDHHG